MRSVRDNRLVIVEVLTMSRWTEPGNNPKQTAQLLKRNFLTVLVAEQFMVKVTEESVQ